MSIKIGINGMGRIGRMVVRSIYENFNDEDAQYIKKLEQKTYHEVKAVEYFLKEK